MQFIDIGHLSEREHFIKTKKLLIFMCLIVSSKMFEIQFITLDMFSKERKNRSISDFRYHFIGSTFNFPTILSQL